MDGIRYLEVAGKLEEQIRKNLFLPGEKLPSLRTVHLQENVSIGTALEAYRHLLDKGVIMAREKSGYFVRPQAMAGNALPKAIPPSLTERPVHIDKRLQQLWKTSPARGFVSFANAIPDPQLLPINSLKRAMADALRDPGGRFLTYEDPKGNLLLRKAIAQRTPSLGSVIGAEDLIITNGATESLNLCLRAVTQPGDTVLVQTPCYYGILQSLELLQLKVVSIPCHADTGIALEDLIDACQRRNVTACVLVSNFNNPNGARLSSEKKQQIAAFAAREKIPVIEDDIYGDIVLQGERPDTIHQYDTGGWVLLCSSFSKSLAPGFRIGWCIPGRYAYEIERMKIMASHASPSIQQTALCTVLQNGVYDRHLRIFRKELDKNRSLMTQAVAQSFPTGTALTRPSGGLVMWIELPPDIDAEKLQSLDFENGIGMAPGTLFSSASSYKNYIRLSYGNVWSKQIENALKKLGKLCFAST
jgi:DNA-binding transcriptional MocR family regulator